MTLLGASFPVSRLILGYPVLTGQALRYALAAAVLGALVRRGPRPGRRAVVRLVALATTGLVGFNICVLGALRHADAPLVGTVVGASPLVLALLGPALAGRRLAAPLLPALGPVRISAWACALAVPLLLGAATLTGEWRHWRVPATGETLGLLYLALPLTVGAFLLWYTGLRRLGVERAGMFAGLLPVATLAATAALDGRVPGTLALAGTVIVAAALVSAGYAERSAARTLSA